MSLSHALTILQINDTHGYLEPHPELVWSAGGATYPTMGGYARIATLLNQARQQNPGGVLALDNGDTFHGTYPAVATKGEALVPLVNALQLDAMTAHWEFAWGPKHFEEMSRRLSHPMLAINCYDKLTGERPFPASIVVERAGLRIGIIGIAATIIDKSMPPHFSEGLRFTLGIDELPSEIATCDRQKRRTSLLCSRIWVFRKTSSSRRPIGGIDIVMSGHTHNRLEQPVRIGTTLIIQSGCHGSFIGRLDLKIESGTVADMRHQLIPVNDSIADDPEMLGLVEDAMRPHRPHVE